MVDFPRQTGREKCGDGKEHLMIQSRPHHVKHVGGSVVAWAAMAASVTGSLVFIDDVTADRSSKM